jgi:hypothetical protein
MTTYYAKPFEKVAEAIYDVNPALYTGLTSRVGRFPIILEDPWNTDYIHYNALRKAVKMRVGDTPGWDAVPDSLPEPGLKKGKFFWWNHEIDEKTYMSLQMNPNGLIAKQVQAELMAQQNYFASQVDLWLNGYLWSSAVDDYDAEWKPMLGLQAATGTVSTPVDINTTPGTADDYTVVYLTGPGTTVDAINTSFGSAKLLFSQQYDSNTHQSMYTGNDTYDVFMHPAVIERLKRGNLSNASGEFDYKESLYTKLTSEFNLIPTWSVDAAYDGASATEAQACMTMNTMQNFQIVESIPYTVQPWQYVPSTNKWRMRAIWKIFPMITPYYISSTWRKAACHLRLIPYHS